jgi:hypothetical protein
MWERIDIMLGVLSLSDQGEGIRRSTNNLLRPPSNETMSGIPIAMHQKEAQRG